MCLFSAFDDVHLTYALDQIYNSQCIYELGGTVITLNSKVKTATHVVVQTNADSTIANPRRVGLLFALCCTPHIVCSKWLLQSHAKNVIVDPTPFRIPSLVQVIERGINARSNGGLLKGFKVYLHRGLDNDVYIPIFEATGATQIDASELLRLVRNGDVENLLVITSPSLQPVKALAIARERKSGVWEMDHRELLSCIENQSIRGKGKWMSSLRITSITCKTHHHAIHIHSQY